MSSSFACAERPILIKCGGFSSQLATHIGKKIDGDPLWGSRFDYENPDAVLQTHLDFLQNGAQIILSNTYQSSVAGFMRYLCLSAEESYNLMCQSVKLAKQARDTYKSLVVTQNGCVEPGLPLVMGSIGPYAAYLHDGSEYHGSYAECLKSEDLVNFHRARIEACLGEGVDGLAIETLPSRMEAETLVDLLLHKYPESKFWVSFQCKDEKSLAHGESFDEAAFAVWKKIQEANAVQRFYGVGVNCLNPKFVVPLFQALHKKCHTEQTLAPPLIVYSNRGETYDSTNGEWTGRENCIPLTSYVPDWIQLGAKVIGGCCRVYPEDILDIRKCVDKLGNNT